jgi:hypothetical protein
LLTIFIVAKSFIYVTDRNLAPNVLPPALVPLRAADLIKNCWAVPVPLSGKNTPSLAFKDAIITPLVAAVAITK